IKSLGVLGDKYVDITIGHATARLEDGGSLPLASEPGIDDLTASAIKTMENVSSLTDKINSGEGSLGQLLTKTEVSDKINSTLSSLHDLATRLTTGNGVAPQLINNGELAQNLSNTLKNLDEASARLKS